MVILSFVVSFYELVTEPFILCICLGFTLCFVFAAPAEADRLLTLLVAFFRPPLADFPQLWSSIKRTYGVLLDQQLEAMSICSQLDSFHTALVELTKQAKSASLVRKEHIIRQLFDIMSVSQDLKVALQDYHFETDMSSYRMIHVHDQALINLQDVIGPLSHLYAPVTPQSERARRNEFVPCLVEHRRSVLRLLTKLECCWSLLHMFGGSINQLDSMMAETNPSLHSYSFNVFSNMWSLLCVDLIDGNGDHVRGSQEALSQGALITMREGIASHLLAGRRVVGEARRVIQNLRDGGSVDDDELRYEEEIKSIVNGIEELRKVRADFQAKRFTQPLPSL